MHVVLVMMETGLVLGMRVSSLPVLENITKWDLRVRVHTSTTFLLFSNDYITICVCTITHLDGAISGWSSKGHGIRGYGFWTKARRWKGPRSPVRLYGRAIVFIRERTGTGLGPLCNDHYGRVMDVLEYTSLNFLEYVLWRT